MESESERRARVTHEAAIRMARLTAQYTKSRTVRDQALTAAAKHEASYVAKYGHAAP